MRLRTTLVLALVAALAAAAYYVVEVRGREAREAAQAAGRRVLDFALDDVSELAVETPGERAVVRADGPGWRIVTPDAGAADGPTVEGLLAFVRRLERVRTLDGAAPDLDDLGLASPTVRLSLGLRDGRTRVLLLGGPNPAATGVYAKLEDAPVIFLAPAALATELAKTPYVDQLRDRTVLAVDPARVRRLEIERADALIAIARVDERRWRVERPFTAAGDDGIIRDLLWKIGATRTRAVIRGPKPAAAYGLDRPHARARLVDDRGVTRTLTLALDPTTSRELYATLDGVAGVLLLTDAQLLSDLAIAPDVLRDRQLLVHEGREIERITIRYPSARLVLERTGERWRVTQPVEADAASTLVDNLLEVLPNLRYTAVAGTSERGLAGYGLERPQLAVTVGLRGGRELPTLVVGRQQGDEHFVMVAGRPAVYKVDSRLLRVIPAAPADAQRYPLPELLEREHKHAIGK